MGFARHGENCEIKPELAALHFMICVDLPWCVSHWLVPAFRRLLPSPAIALPMSRAFLTGNYLGRDVKLAESAVKKLERNERRTNSTKRLQNASSRTPSNSSK